MINITITLNDIYRYCITYVSLYTSMIIYYHLHTSTLASIPLNCWKHPARTCHSPSWEQWSCSWLWQFSNQTFPSSHLARKGSKCPTKSISKITMIIKMYCKSVHSKSVILNRSNMDVDWSPEPAWSVHLAMIQLQDQWHGLASRFMTKHKRKPESYFHEAFTSNVLRKELPDSLLWAHRGEQLSRFWTARLVPKCHSSFVPLETVLQWKHVSLSSSAKVKTS